MLKGTNTEKKKAFKSTIKNYTGEKTEPLQTATRASSRSKVKRKLLNDNEVEESNADCETDDI